MKFNVLGLLLTLAACTSPAPKSGSAEVDHPILRTTASEEEFPPEDESTYRKLAVKEVENSHGSNSVHFEKNIGRLTCAKVVAKNENVVVGYRCDLAEYRGNDFAPGDDKIYRALKTKEVYFGRGANSIRMQKIVGRLACVKTMAADKTIVGFECNM